MLLFILPLIFLVAGFLFVIKGASFLIDGAVAIAVRYRISYFVIGLTIVAFGTSAPEFCVNLIASFQGSGGLAIGNIVGSNIANILLALGITVIIIPVAVPAHILKKDLFLNVLGACILLSFLVFSSSSPVVFEYYGGILLLALFALFLWLTLKYSKKDSDFSSDAKEHIKDLSLSRSIVYILIGLVGLGVGGEFIVRGASSIADFFHISKTVVGLTVVAIGTSMPEVAASITAARRNNPNMAVGNVLGSNIFNLLLVLGSSSVISSLKFDDIKSKIIISDIKVDIILMTFVTLLILIFAFIGKKYYLKRWQGIIFVLLYLFYLTFVVYRAIG